MDLTLIRNYPSEDGVFGDLYQTESGDFMAVTLEHAYDAGLGNGSYSPKIPAGIYTCERYWSPKHGYEVFRLLAVPGSTYDEIHIGNYNRDSDGCILLGETVVNARPPLTERWLAASAHAFMKFMAKLQDVDQFTLTIKDA